MRAVANWMLVLAAGCSYSFPTSRPTVTASTSRAVCSNRLATVDSMLGAGMIGAGAGVMALVPFNSDSTATVIAASALVAGGTAFLLSARRGFAATESCRREVVEAMQPDLTPVEPIALTCEQRRLDMYSRAVTGANAEQRVRLLSALPSCEEGITRERAWVLTRMAALDAGAGKCDDIEEVAREVYELDVVLHDVVLLGDVEIKNCLQLREL